MHSTPVSLLDRIRLVSEKEAWDQFVRLYTPLLMYWGRRLGFQDDDAADLAQDVLLVLVQKLPQFHYRPGGSFRSWMRTILINIWRDRRKSKPTVPLAGSREPETPAESEILEEREYRLYVLSRALRMMSVDFEPTTWKACWETVVRDRPAAEVATELEITVNAVYLAKSRVLSRLRRDLDGLLD